jgi:hypothetical protein
MATIIADRAKDGVPAFEGPPGNLCVAYGTYDFASAPSAADVLKICKLPAGAIVLGGFLRAEDLDSNATETIEMDVGTPADPDAFLNSGALNGDAVTNVLPEGGVLIPLHGTLAAGPVAITAETVVQVTFTAAAATFASGAVTVVIYYTYA